MIHPKLRVYWLVFFCIIFFLVQHISHAREHSRDMFLKWEWHKFFYSLVSLCVRLCVLQWNVLLFRQFFSSFSWCIWKYRLIYTPQWSIYKIKVENGFKPLTRPSIFRFIVSVRSFLSFFLSFVLYLFLFVVVNVWVNFVFALSVLFLRDSFFIYFNQSHGIPESILAGIYLVISSQCFSLFNEEHKESRYIQKNNNNKKIINSLFWGI